MSLSQCYLWGSLPTRWRDQPLGPTLLVDSVELLPPRPLPHCWATLCDSGCGSGAPRTSWDPWQGALVGNNASLRGCRYPQVLNPWLGHAICAHLLRSLLLYFLQKCTICLSSSFRFTACTLHFIIKKDKIKGWLWEGIVLCWLLLFVLGDTEVPLQLLCLPKACSPEVFWSFVQVPCILQ